MAVWPGLKGADPGTRLWSQRRREAVDRVTIMQFDRHGNRSWCRAQTLLDTEYARRAIGELQVPYGLCTEPSIAAAGGGDCPRPILLPRLRPLPHRRLLPPGLEAYLADLLRNRERLAAFADADTWA
ncbi:hypothetical protein J1792_31630 [Streptomyces triculaminicus]|uniref:Uncharacterized protein n=1 Tax=Streptomyces triculaminicus TaxID=2816232 RepID=A0A939FSK2_9ACTN|nr:hypothetical protein [Streptomyces triculaminicus]MBO0657113.1 hypothetical protein [Streptomyces triculaminicus]